MNNLSFSGTAEPNSMVTISVNGVPFTQKAADGAGHYVVVLTLALDGTNAITAKAANSTGTGPNSAPLSLTIDTASPSIFNGYYDRETSQGVSASVSNGRASHMDWHNVFVTNLSTGATAPAVKSLSYDVQGGIALLDFTKLFADGRYRITFPLGAVSDVAGNLSPEYDFYFNQLNGDANYDNTVDFKDLVVLAQYYNTSGNSFSRGNFDYSVDGRVDFSDLVILAQHYNVTLPPAGLAASVLQELAADDELLGSIGRDLDRLAAPALRSNKFGGRQSRPGGDEGAGPVMVR